MTGRRPAPAIPRPRRRRVPVMRQAEAAECGLCCLGMVAARYDPGLTLSQLRTRHRLSSRGMTLADLIRLADTLGLDSRPVRVDLPNLRKLALPAIVHWNLDHFVVLEKVHAAGVRIVDPATGRRRVSLAEFSRAFTGVACELRPRIDFESLADPARPFGLRAIVSHTPGLSGALVKLAIASLALQAAALCAPLAGQLIIDDVLVHADRDLLSAVAVAFAGLALLHAVLRWCRSWLLLVITTRLTEGWLAALVNHLLHLPLGYFETRHVGDIQSRVRSMSEVHQIVTDQFVASLMDGVLTVVTLLLMWHYAPALATVVIAAVAAYGVLRCATASSLSRRTAGWVSAEARRDHHLLETLRGIATIKSYNREMDRQLEFCHRNAAVLDADVARQRIVLAAATANQLLFAMENLAVLYLGATEILTNRLTVGMLVAFMAYKAQFAERAAGLVDRLVEFVVVRVHLDRVSDIVRTPTESVPRGPIALGVSGGLELDDVWFRYADSGPWVVRAVSCSIRPGEHVVLTGPSGSGKSTLLKLMAGLLVPTTGTVRIDGRSLASIPPGAYRRCCGTVLQADALLSGTLLDNISCFDPEPDSDRVRWAAEQVGIAEHVDSLPMGYDTWVGDMGDSLSGGERQRLLLARALYPRPAILFLDEATSHLDADTAQHVQRAIDALTATRVVVAHREAAIASADRVIGLDRTGAAATPTLTSDRAPASPDRR